jgi:hypothetical protein
MFRKYFHGKSVTTLIGNRDLGTFHALLSSLQYVCYHTEPSLAENYGMHVTDPEKESIPEIAAISDFWKNELHGEAARQFESYGYLWYPLEANLIIITLNTIPYSVTLMVSIDVIVTLVGRFATPQTRHISTTHLINLPGSKKRSNKPS